MSLVCFVLFSLGPGFEHSFHFDDLGLFNFYMPINLTLRTVKQVLNQLLPTYINSTFRCSYLTMLYVVWSQTVATLQVNYKITNFI